MYKFLKAIYFPFSLILTLLNTGYTKLFYFLFPNLRNLLLKRIIINGNWPICVQPTYFTGMGISTIGTGCKFGYKHGGYFRNGSIEFQARYKTSKILIGEDVITNNNIFICCANYVEIGRKTLIGQYVTIMDHEAHGIDPFERHNIGEIGTVCIGENVWIGNNVIILKNSIIGDNSIIAAGSVVSGTFNDNVVIGGIPAKFIKAI